MKLKNFVISAALSSFGFASLAHASDYPVSCAENDGGPKGMNCISISNNSKKHAKKLHIECETEKGHLYWTIDINAGKQNQCLNLDSSCKIPRLLDNTKHKAVITVDHEILWTTCNWPGEES